MISLEALKKRFLERRQNKKTSAETVTSPGILSTSHPVKHDRYYTKISAYLFYLLSFVVCYEAAVLFWHKMPYKNQVLAGLTAQELKQIQNPGNTVRLSNYNLFGVEAKNQLEQKSSGAVVRSRLDVKITGISYSSDPSRGAVVFLMKGSEDVYSVGDKINGTNAVISQIKPTEIVINNAGVEEVIKLPEDVFVSGVADRKTEKNGKTESATVKEDLKTVRTELLSNPSNLFNYINIAPAQEDGKIIGYELNPGAESKLFIDAGLKAGDIAVEINGKDLTDSQQAMAVMGELQNMTQINIVVNRNGSRETIVLDIQ